MRNSISEEQREIPRWLNFLELLPRNQSESDFFNRETLGKSRDLEAKRRTPYFVPKDENDFRREDWLAGAANLWWEIQMERRLRTQDWNELYHFFCAQALDQLLAYHQADFPIIILRAKKAHQNFLNTSVADWKTCQEGLATAYNTIECSFEDVPWIAKIISGGDFLNCIPADIISAFNVVELESPDPIWAMIKQSVMCAIEAGFHSCKDPNEFPGVPYTIFNKIQDAHEKIREARLIAARRACSIKKDKVSKDQPRDKYTGALNEIEKEFNLITSQDEFDKKVAQYKSTYLILKSLVQN